MLIINTTFFVANTHINMFQQWVNETYTPRMINTGHFSDSKLYKVLSHQEQDATNYSLQLCFEEPKIYTVWEDNYHQELQQELKLLFGENILSFSTLLEAI